MEDIAGEAELSTGTLYLYFKSKDEIYLSLNMRILTFLNEKLQELQTQVNLPLRRRVHDCISILLSMYYYDPFAVRFLFHIQAGEDLKNLTGDVKAELIELSQTAIRTIAAIITGPAQEEITFKGHPIALADIFWSVFTGLILWEESKASLKAGPNHLDATVELAAEMFYRALTCKDAQ
jgi:AcrR family transcriptional regulator